MNQETSSPGPTGSENPSSPEYHTTDELPSHEESATNNTGSHSISDYTDASVTRAGFAQTHYNVAEARAAEIRARIRRLLETR